MLQVNLKSSAPYKPIKPPVGSHIKRISFPDDARDSVCKEKEKRESNERIFKLNGPSAKQNSISSTQSIKVYPSYLNQRIGDVSFGSSQVGESGKEVSEKNSNTTKTPK